MLQPKKKLDTGHYRTTTGNVVIWGTPEYKKAYDKGEVITNKGVKSPITIQGQKLKEIVVKNNYKRNSLEQYKDKIIEENKDSGVLGATIGTPISAVASLPQLFATKAITGKMQRPSEAINVKNPYGAAIVDAVTDPANLIGAGVLTKEKVLSNIARSTEEGLLSNTHKINPWSFKPDPKKFYRQVDDITYKEGIKDGLIRGKQNIGHKGIEGVNLNKAFGDDAYYNKGSLYYKNNKDLSYLFEANLSEDKFIPKVNGRTRKYTTENTSVRVSKEPLSINDPNITTYKKDWLQGYKKLQQGGYINQNTNMNRYAQGGDLTQFNEGGLHSQNPLGGVPIGNNNSVEQGETKQNNFIYSNRIFLDSNIISQYNLPKSLVGKSVADATKFIDNKFKGRNDKISQSTKNLMLSKIAEAQEAMKPQEPEMEQPQEGMGQSSEMMDNNQMWDGGFKQSVIGQGFGEDATGAQQSAAIGAGLGTLTTALDLGKTAFGKPAQDTSGLVPSAKVNSGGMIAGSAMKGASAGMAFGPLGAGIGAAIGGVAGLLGSNKAKKAAIENTNNSALNANNQFSDKYAMGGLIDPPTKITKTNLVNTPIIQGVNPSVQSDRFRYAVGEQGGVQHGTSGEQGHYLYYDKKPGDAGFNPNVHREFVNQGGYDTYMKSPQGQQYRRNLQTQTVQPIEQLSSGGKMKKMGDGGYYDKNNPYFMTNPGPVNMGPNPAPIESILQQSGLKPIGTTVPYTIATQPKVDISNANRIATPGPSTLDMLKYNAGKVGNYVNKNAGNIARYAPIAANALQLAQLKKPQGERLDRLDNRYRPEYVDEAQLQNIANQTMNNSVNAVGQSGASQGQLRSSIIGSQLQRTKALSDSYSQAAAQNRQQNAMAQQFNLGVDQVNLQQSNSEKDINARNKGAYDTEKSKLIGKIGENIGNVGTEQAYKKIAVTTTGYNWLGEFQKMNPNATKEETVIAAKKAGVTIDNDKTVKKQALGGYLIKNKVK